MVQAPAKPGTSAEPVADLHPAPVPLKLTLPEGWESTDDALIELARLNEPWRFELTADRELVIMSPEGPGSSMRGADVIAQVFYWSVNEGGGAVFGPHVGVRLRDTAMREPDVAWMSDQLWGDRDPDEGGLLQDCPELIVEIVSKSDAAEEQQDKMVQWMSNGALLGWLIDPFRNVVLVYRPDAEPEQLVRPASLSGEDVCEGLEVSLERIWK